MHQGSGLGVKLAPDVEDKRASVGDARLRQQAQLLLRQRRRLLLREKVLRVFLCGRAGVCAWVGAGVGGCGWVSVCLCVCLFV